MLKETYGSAKVSQALSIVEQYERDGHDRYSEQGETYLIRKLASTDQGAVFRNN